MRKLFTVIFARQPSEDEDDEDGEHSSMVGMGFGVWDRERVVKVEDFERMVSGVFTPRSVLVLELRLERKEDLRDDKGDEEEEPAWALTNEESML